jgi:hypothetical protein
MSDYPRLRQICIVTPQFDYVNSEIHDIFGIEICHRDSESLKRFGLENSIFVIGTNFLEVQAPIEPNTAAGRFIERTKGHGGYNIVVEVSDDPKRRQAHAKKMDIRIALEIDQELYQGVQLHPRDCRATMIEFARPTEADHRKGGWWPAGEGWRDFVRTTETKRILGIELESPNPDDLAAHWSQIIETALKEDNGHPFLILDDVTIRFVDGETECLSAVVIEVTDVDRTASRAIARGHCVEHDSFHLGGVYFRLRGSI